MDLIGKRSGDTGRGLGFRHKHAEAILIRGIENCENGEYVCARIERHWWESLIFGYLVFLVLVVVCIFTASSALSFGLASPGPKRVGQ
jgi:hypothetical protein